MRTVNRQGGTFRVRPYEKGFAKCFEGPMVEHMNRPIPNGFLIAIEGIDGAGKTSIATLLAQWCGERGLGCMISKEPTGNQWGEQLRESARNGRLSVEEELRLLELDRRQHIETAIQPALDEGNIVILDRYYWSSAAYQGSHGANYEEVIRMNETYAPIPDLFILLDIEPDGGLQRIRMRGDSPNHFESKSSLILARNIFNQLAEQHENAIRVDSSGSIKDTFRTCLLEFQARAMNKISNGRLHPQMLTQTLQLFGGLSLEDPVEMTP